MRTNQILIATSVAAVELVSALAAAQSPAARAETTKTTSAIGTEDSGSTHGASPDSKPTVDELYAAAKERYMAGDREGALDLMLRCYDASHKHNLLFNLGQLNAELSRCEAAIDYYQRYLEGAPNGRARDTAVAQIEQLQQRCPKQSAKPTALEPATPSTIPAPQAVAKAAHPPQVKNPEVTMQPTPGAATHPASTQPITEEARPSRVVATAGWVALGAGAVATGAGIYFAVKTHQAGDDVEKRKYQLGRVSWGESGIEESMQDFSWYRGWAIASSVTAGAVTALGLYLLLFAQPQAKPKSYAVSMSPALNGALLTFQHDL